MIELIQGEGGVQPFDKDEIKKLSKTLKEKGVLLIVDEVQTGGYRTGEFLASNLYDIQPDIITLAKGIGGGVPIGVVMTTLKDIFSPGDHGSTFGGNYLVTSASLEVCTILEDLKENGTLNDTIKYFDSKLSEFYENNKDKFTDVVGIGLMRGLRVIDEDTLKNVVDTAFENGILVLKSGRNTLRFLPPLTITNKEVDLGFQRLSKTLSQLKN
jgi:acetylornithine aminotransferase